MIKTVRIGKIEDQDEFRRDDIRKMHPNERVALLLDMQSRWLGWHADTKYERIVTIKRVRNVESINN